MTTNNRVPFLDLITSHRELKDELCEVFHTVLDTAGFIGGPMVEAFERDFAKFCSAQHCVGVGSGTDALRFALIAAGLEEGDIVLTVPNTFIATTEAISQAGGFADFIDVDEYTHNMDPEELRNYLESKCSVNRRTGALMHRKLGRRVAAVVPVHLYGRTADMDPILELAERYKLVVIEDACQAHGAEYFSRKDQRWKEAGSMGLAGAFSFYPGKNLGACGEAGAITTNDADLARRMRMLRDHGQVRKYYHDVSGYNGRLDALQAGILSVKLQHLASWNESRQRAASIYDEMFFEGGRGDLTPSSPSWSRSVYHLYVIRDRDRDRLIRELSARGIDTGIHYPVPLHLQNAYKHLGFKAGDFPVAEKSASEVLSLPMFPQLMRAQQERVVDAVVKFASEPEVVLIKESARYMTALG
jgi:dTDP-4-amino-4,6-dideoxygalactose transaminase